jgi:hypothetical protein
MTDIVDELRSHFNGTGIIKSATSDLVKAAAAEIVRLRAASEWRDISTAPRDGTRILAIGGGLGVASYDVEIVSYNEVVGAWNTPNFTLDDRDDEPDGYCRPTLWQPLPAPPQRNEVTK